MKKMISLLILFVTFACYAQSKADIEWVKKNLEDAYIQMCAQINRQAPIRVDEITTLNSAVFIDWTVSMYYSVDIDVDDYEESEIKEFLQIIKNEQIKKLPKMLNGHGREITQKDLYETFKLTGLKYRAIYLDINNDIIGTIYFDCNDFKPLPKNVKKKRAKSSHFKHA